MDGLGQIKIDNSGIICKQFIMHTRIYSYIHVKLKNKIHNVNRILVFYTTKY